MTPTGKPAPMLFPDTQMSGSSPDSRVRPPGPEVWVRLVDEQQRSVAGAEFAEPCVPAFARHVPPPSVRNGSVSRTAISSSRSALDRFQVIELDDLGEGGRSSRRKCAQRYSISPGRHPLHASSTVR
jgi:hypothetical protein